MIIEFVLLIIGSYILGSVPAAYLAARWFRGTDIRQHGTGNVGASNLLEITSKRIAAPVFFYDLIKGMILLSVAYLIGLSIAQQVTIGVAAIVGHNWPVFLRFNGGRGVMTTAGVAFILPLLNGLWPWETIAFCAITLISIIANRSTVPGVSIGIAAMPLVSWILDEPPPFTLGLLAMLLIMIIRRLTVPRAAGFEWVGPKQLLVNRLLFDRDILNKEAWMNRDLPETGPGEQPFSQQARKGKG